MNPDFKPLNLQTWADLQGLFGDRGACGGCWCMTWRLRNKEYELNKGAGNKDKFYQLVQAEFPLGVLAYHNQQPIGWCSVSPRESLIRLENSRMLKRIDDQPVWSITCLFVPRHFQRQGLSSKLITAAVEYAISNGATIIEAYPIVPKKQQMPSVFAWVGFEKSYLEAGFLEEARPSDHRLIMRKYR